MNELINYNATLNLENENSHLDAVIGSTNPLVPASDKINSGNSVNNSVIAKDSANQKDISPTILDLKVEEINQVILPVSSTTQTSIFSNDITSKSSISDTGIDTLTGLKVNEAVIDNSKPDSLTNPSASQSQTLTGILPDTKTDTDSTNNKTEQSKGNVTPATSQSKTPDVSITSTENVPIAPLDSGSTAPVSSEQPFVTTESSASVTGDAVAIVSDTPKNPDSAVVTNNNSAAIASEVSKSDTAVVTTAAATSDPAKTETEVTSTNSGDLASNNPAKNPDSAVVTNNNSEAIASEVSKSDTAVVTTAAATSDPAKTETEVTSANSDDLAPAIEKPSVSVVETSPVTNKTAVTSESENKAIASTSDITDSSQTPKNLINSTTAGVTKTSITSTPAQNITQLTSQSFTFNTGVFKVDETGKVGIDYLFDGGGYEGELGIFNLEGMENLAQNSDAFITEAARRAVSNSNLGYVVINDATEGARFNGALPYDINRNRGEYKGVKTFTMLPGDTFALILVPNGANLQQVANESATGDDARPLFSLPMANPNGSFMTGQIADVTGVGNTFVMEDLRVDQPGTDSDYNDIIFQVRGATGSAVSIDSVINPKKEWRSTDLGKALTEYAKAYVTPENPKVGELVTDELYDSVFGNKDNQVDNNSKTEAIASEVSKSDTPVVTAPATSDPAKTETGATSTNPGAIAPTTEKPSISVEGNSPVTDKTVVTSESENQPLDSGSTTPVSPQQSVVTAESSSSVTGDAGAIVSDTPKTSDSAVVTDNNSGAIASEVSKSDSPVVTTAPATSEPAKTEAGLTSTNSGAIVPTTPNNNSASNTPPTVVETVANKGEEIGELAPISQDNNSTSTTQPTVSEPAKTEADLTSTNSGAIVPTTPNNNSASNTPPTVVETVANKGEEIGAIAPISQDNNSTSTTQPTVGETVASKREVTGAIAQTPQNSNYVAIAQHSVEPEIPIVGVTKNPENFGNNEVAVTATGTSSSENTGVDATSDLADNWLSQLNQELKNLDSQVQGELTTLKNTISTTTGGVNSQVQELGGIIGETKTSLNTSVAFTGTQLSGIKDQMNGSVNSTRGQLDIIEMGLTTQVAGLETKLSETKSQLNSGVSGLNTRLTNDTTLMAGKVTAAKNKKWESPTTAFRPQDHGTEVTPEQQQEINKYTSQLQKDRTNAIKAVETANTNAGNSAKTQFTALSTAKDKVINEAQAKLDPSKQSKDAAIKDVETGFTGIKTSISNLDSQLAGLQTFKDNILTNAQTQFNELEQLKDDTITQTKTQFDTLSNSWSDWVNDTKDQIKVWTQIADSEDRWFDTTPRNPSQKVGLPLVGIIDTGFNSNNPDIDYSRITLGKDWVDGDANPLLSSSAEKEHGTQLLEVIAATRNNGIGIDGINDKSPLWLGRAIGSNNWAQSLIEFVDAAKASKEPNAVVNLSFDLTQTNPDGSVTTRYELTAVERAALTYAKQNNILIVTSTGNQGTTMSALAQATKEFDNIFVVGAAEGWQRAGYSSYGEVDSANYGKGVDILAQGSSSNGASGTSVAAAKVTGAVSLVWAANPGLNHTQVMDILRRTATDLNTPNWDAQTGMGLLNIAAAVHLAKATKPEVYIPRELQLVQETLKTYQIPEVHWPQFYEYYYRAELETQFTGSKFVDSAWTNPGWGVSASVITTERATGRRQRVEDVFSQEYSSWNPKYPSRSKAEKNAYNRANELRRELRLPEIVYVRYEVTSGGGDSRTHVWKEIDLDAKADYDRKVKELNAAKKFVEDKKKEIDAAKAATQKEIDALKAKIVATEKELQAALSNATNTQPAKIEELKKQLAGLKIQLADSQVKADSLIKALEAQLEAAETKLSDKTKAVEDSVTKAKADLEAEIKAAEAAIEARKQRFFDKLGASVTQFSKDLGESIKSNLKGVDVGAVLDALKKIPVVGTVVNGIEGLIALVQNDWKAVVKSGINGVLKIIPGGSAVPETLVNILINVGWGIISKDYKTALKDVLKELDVKDKVANTFVDVAWAMKDGDWKNVLSAGLSGAGFSNADKFVGIAWGVKDGDYTNALTAGLEVAGLDKLGINSSQSQAFVKSAIALKDNQTSKVADELLSVAGTEFASSSWVQDLKDSNPNNDRGAVTQGLSDVGFKNVEQWVNMAWDVKDKNYLSAISTGFSLAGFSQGKDWVDMAWSLQQGDYLKALSTGFKVAGFPEGEHLAKAAVNLREGKYLDAFFEGIRMVPGVGDLVNAFKAVGDGNFKGVANSLAKVATNPTLLKLLVS
jgi:hypothetical protein